MIFEKLGWDRVLCTYSTSKVDLISPEAFFFCEAGADAVSEAKQESDANATIVCKTCLMQFF